MAVVAPMFPDDNSILEQMCQPAIQTILNFENSESIRIEQKNAGKRMAEKKNKVLGTEYQNHRKSRQWAKFGGCFGNGFDSGNTIRGSEYQQEYSEQ